MGFHPARSRSNDLSGHNRPPQTCFAYLPIDFSIRCATNPMHSGKNPGRPDRLGAMYPLWVGVTMSLHKLTAGSGYDYLTRQVAAFDATEKGHIGLASYYTERGETPSVWIGSVDEIDGLTANDPVTAEQMRALFGCGLHPLGRAAAAAAGRTRSHPTRLPGRSQARGAVQDLRW
jgi:hypothetical protein